MRILISAGPTREPIDAVRFLSNRSSGKMGAAVAAAALRAHDVTVIAGPMPTPIPATQIVQVESAAEMQRAIEAHFPKHDLLIMAAAVADYRPKVLHAGKLDRAGPMSLELEPTEDIVAAASRAKRPDQRTVAFSLETAGNIERAREKMLRKGVDLMVFNPTSTMSSETVEATLLYPDGRSEQLPSRSKDQFADILLARVVALF